MKNVNEIKTKNQVNSADLAQQKRAEKNQSRRERYHEQKLKRKSNENTTSTSTFINSNGRTKTNVSPVVSSQPAPKKQKLASNSQAKKEVANNHQLASKKANVSPPRQRERKDYQRKLMADLRAKREGLKHTPLNLDENCQNQSPEFAKAQELIHKLEIKKAKGEVFPLHKLKEHLLKQNEEYLNIFEELLRVNRAQYRHLKKMCLPLTLATFRHWREEKEKIVSQPALPTNSSEVKEWKSYSRREFLYDVRNNRLWYHGQEVWNKEVTKQGRYSFLWKSSADSTSHLYLELTPERSWQLRAYCQEVRAPEIRHFQAYFSYKQTNLVKLSFHNWNEVATASAGTFPLVKTTSALTNSPAFT